MVFKFNMKMLQMFWQHKEKRLKLYKPHNIVIVDYSMSAYRILYKKVWRSRYLWYFYKHESSLTRNLIRGFCLTFDGWHSRYETCASSKIHTYAYMWVLVCNSVGCKYEKYFCEGVEFTWSCKDGTFCSQSIWSWFLPICDEE